jgi:hypothetical protein
MELVDSREANVENPVIVLRQNFRNRPSLSTQEAGINKSRQLIVSGFRVNQYVFQAINLARSPPAT